MTGTTDTGSSSADDVRARLQGAAAGEGVGLRRGLWLTCLDAYGLEVAIGCGLDWVGVDLQHGNIELSDLPGLLRVAEAAAVPREPGKHMSFVPWLEMAANQRNI